VTSWAGGKSVGGRTRDGAPLAGGGAINPSHGAAKKLGRVNAVLSQVRITPLTGSRLGDRRSAPSRPQPRLLRRPRQVNPAQPPVPTTPLKGVVVLERREVEGSLF